MGTTSGAKIICKKSRNRNKSKFYLCVRCRFLASVITSVNASGHELSMFSIRFFFIIFETFVIYHKHIALSVFAHIHTYVQSLYLCAYTLYKIVRPYSFTERNRNRGDCVNVCSGKTIYFSTNVLVC